MRRPAPDVFPPLHLPQPPSAPGEKAFVVSKEEVERTGLVPKAAQDTLNPLAPPVGSYAPAPEPAPAPAPEPAE